MGFEGRGWPIVTRTPGRRAVLRRVGLSALSVATGLGLGEGVQRYREARAPRAGPELAYRCDAELGWRGIPGAAFRVEMPDGGHLVRRNRLGMHDVDHAPEPPAGATRVLALGDSFVESLQVPLEKTLPRQLESSLNGSGTGVPVEVVAAGIGGWGLQQELLWLEAEGLAMRPALVVAFWFPGNDAGDVLPSRRYQTCSGRSCYSPYFVLEGDRLEERPWRTGPMAPIGKGGDRAGRKAQAAALGRLYEWSALWRGLSPLLPGRWDGFAFPAGALGYGAEVFQVELGLRLGRAALERMAERARRPVAVVTLPDRPLIEGVRSGDAAAFRARGKLESFAGDLRRDGHSVLDLHQAFLSFVTAGGDPYWADSHLKEAGNRLAAQSVAEHLEREGLLKGVR